MKITTKVSSVSSEHKPYEVGGIVQSNECEDIIGVITDIDSDDEDFSLMSLSCTEEVGVGEMIGWQPQSEYHYFEGILTITCNR